MNDLSSHRSPKLPFPRPRAWKAYRLRPAETTDDRRVKLRVLSISVSPSDLHEVSLLRDTASKRASSVSTYASGGCRFAKGTALVPLDERSRAADRTRLLCCPNRRHAQCAPDQARYGLYHTNLRLGTVGKVGSPRPSARSFFSTVCGTLVDWILVRMRFGLLLSGDSVSRLASACSSAIGEVRR